MFFGYRVAEKSNTVQTIQNIQNFQIIICIFILDDYYITNIFYYKQRLNKKHGTTRQYQKPPQDLQRQHV